ncbi:hypothetical protein CFIMG_006926RA [Ceratocystis fimbriata CBS 114723]|uniref:WSC domain-containing protein n=1 Tax=Ceratocystis fimbriata CBS 114723 TaxID=1035309 RepID=A0A2C5WSW4_9PEZI|nr:hypothetical protein CFIMG_006926RA [Ceratocystis fimbriata CBS 114723]
MQLLYPIILALVALFEAALAQSQYAMSGFKYDGCVEVDPNRFDVMYAHPAGGRTPEDCQYVCRGYTYVGVFNDACRCGNDAGELNRQDEDVCNNPCKGDSSLGWCGSSSPTCGKYANLYCATSKQPVPDSPTYEPDDDCDASTSTEWTSLDSYTYGSSPTDKSACTPTLPLTYSYWDSDASGSYTLTTVTSTLGTYTHTAHTTTETKEWTTTLSGATAAYTTVTFTSAQTSVITGDYTSTAVTTYVTTTAASSSSETQTQTQTESLANGGPNKYLKASLMAAVVAIMGAALV